MISALVMRAWLLTAVFILGCDGSIGVDDASTSDAANDVHFDATTEAAVSTTLTLELDYPNNGPTLLLTLTKQ